MGKRGIVGLELAVFAALVGGAVFWLHIELMELGNKKMQNEDEKRIPYTGVLQWKH